jgi:hypothetical protein
VDDVEQMLNRVKQSEGMEGFVLVFQDNGEMFKMKSEWYFERSRKQAGTSDLDDINDIYVD